MLTSARASLTILLLILVGCSGIEINDHSSKPSNKRSMGQKFQDHATAAQIVTLLEFENPAFKDQAQIEVLCSNGIVVITGQVPTWPMKEAAAKAAKKQEGVRKIYNQLNVSKKIHQPAGFSDSWMGFRLRFAYLFNDKVPSSQVIIKVISGDIYLMGYLPQHEAEKAIEIARKTKGAKKVINAFEYSS